MSPLVWLSKLLAGPVVEAVTDVYKANLKAGVDKNKLEADVKKAVLVSLTDTVDKQANVITAEVNSQDKLVRRWRPITALALGFVLIWYSLMVPIAVDWFGMPPLRVGDLLLSWIYAGFTLMVGGYIGARSIEKIASMVITRWR